MKVIADILLTNYPTELVNNIMNSYKEIEENFSIKKWKLSELDAGHFVESVRRLLEYELFGSYTPFNQNIAKFNDGTLKSYEQATGKDEAYRILIPRILKPVYDIRNKRGVGHITGISPNIIDSTYIMSSIKWVLAELIRLNSNRTFDETQKLINRIVERNLEIVWQDGDILRILHNKMIAKNQIIVLLYCYSPMIEETLRRTIEYKNQTKFRQILKELHKERFIEYKENRECEISPKGVLRAEEILNNELRKEKSI